MLKYALLTAVMTMSVPALAQAQVAPAPTPPATAAQAPVTATPPAPVTDPMSPAPATADAATATSAPADDAAMPSKTAQAAPTPAADTGVGAVVDKEFASYDKDSNGELSKAEFGAWMDALKAKSPDASKQAADPKWNDAAFAQADVDKSKALSKVELTSFLSNATKSAS